MSLTSETIIINKPSDKLLAMMKRMQEHKLQVREEVRNATPMFTLEAE